MSALTDLYARLPNVACKGLCYRECQAQVGAWPVERRAMERATGKPYVFHVIEQRCGYLTPANQCSVYEQRPYICRAYGAAEHLRCAHGCEPDGLLTDDQAAADFKTLDQLSGHKPRQLPKVVR